MMLKLKFTWNSTNLDITNTGLDSIIYSSEEILGVVDLRYLSYYTIKEGMLQQNVSKFYIFKMACTLCEQFNKFINTLKKEEKKDTKEHYP